MNKSRNRWRTLCIVISLLFVFQGIFIGKKIGDIIENQRTLFHLQGIGISKKMNDIIENQQTLFHMSADNMRSTALLHAQTDDIRGQLAKINAIFGPPDKFMTKRVKP